MNNMLAPPIAADLPATLQTFGELVALLADPAATKKRVAEMSAATTALLQATAEHKAKTAEFAVVEAEHQAARVKAAAEHADRLSKERTAFDAACAQRKSELDSRDQQIKELQAQAKTDADDAAAMRADLERRLQMIKQASLT